MKTKLLVPRLEFTMESCTVEEILVENGQYVEEKQPIAVVLSNKADVELTAERAGYIKLLVEVDDEMKPEEVFGYIADTKEELDG